MTCSAVSLCCFEFHLGCLFVDFCLGYGSMFSLLSAPVNTGMVSFELHLSLSCLYMCVVCSWTFAFGRVVPTTFLYCQLQYLLGRHDRQWASSTCPALLRFVEFYFIFALDLCHCVLLIWMLLAAGSFTAASSFDAGLLLLRDYGFVLCCLGCFFLLDCFTTTSLFGAWSSS